MTEEWPEHGIFYDFNEKSYHRDPRSLSSTTAKNLIYSGPDAVLEDAEKPPAFSDAFDHGSVIHALVLGVGDYEVFDYRDWRTKEARMMRELRRVEGVAPVLRRDFVEMEKMAKAVHGHPIAASLLSSGHPEVSMWGRDPLTGVLMRGRVDWWNGAVADLKTTKGRVSQSAWVNTAWAFHYAFQFAYYNRIMEINDQEPGWPAWIVVSKQEPYEVAVWEPSPELMRRAEIDVDRSLWLYAHVLETGQWPDLKAAYAAPGVGAPPRGWHIPFIDSVSEGLTQTKVA